MAPKCNICGDPMSLLLTSYACAKECDRKVKVAASLPPDPNLTLAAPVSTALTGPYSQFITKVKATLDAFHADAFHALMKIARSLDTGASFRYSAPQQNYYNVLTSDFLNLTIYPKVVCVNKNGLIYPILNLMGGDLYLSGGVQCHRHFHLDYANGMLTCLYSNNEQNTAKQVIDSLI